MRALLYLNLDSGSGGVSLVDDSGSTIDGGPLADVISAERQHPSEQTFRVTWTSDAASAESFHALPLVGRQGDLLGVLLVGSSEQREVVEVSSGDIRDSCLLLVSGHGVCCSAFC